jgi:hypothetical protein
MRLITPRDLVRCRLGDDRLTRKRLDRALRALALDGWAWGYQPSHKCPDRTLPIVRQDELIAPLLRLTREAAAGGGDALAVVPRAMIESELDLTLQDAYAGRVLGNYGLVIQADFDDQVHLVGTSPELARKINNSRYPHKRQRRHLVSIIVHAARGLGRRPKRITDDARLETVQVLERFAIRADEILDGHRLTSLISKWHMPELANDVAGIDTTGQNRKQAC